MALLKIRNKYQSTNATDLYKANKVASWLLRYLSELEGDDSQGGFRNMDKAAFMLGFDLAQLES